MPFLTFARNSTAYLSDGTLVNTNLPRFVPGRFGQAVMVEEATTNLASDTNWASGAINLVSDGTAGPAVAFDNTVSLDAGSGSGRMVWSRATSGWADGNCHVGNSNVVIPPNEARTFSVWIQGNTNFSISMVITGTHGWGSIPANVTTSWQRFSITVTNTLTVNTSVAICFFNVSSAATMWVDMVQVENKPYPTTWQLGGTPRVIEMLTIPTAGVLSPTEGTIEFWWTPINQPPSNITYNQNTAPQIIRVGSYHSDGSWLLWAWEGLRLYVRGNGATSWTGVWTIVSGWAWYVLNQPVHFAVRWTTANTFHVFVNGVRYGPFVSTHNFTSIAGNILELGGQAASGPANAHYDDLRISSRARTDAEILNSFNSNAPLSVDADTTAMVAFDNNIGSRVVTYSSSMPAITVPSSLGSMGFVHEGLTVANVVPSAERETRFSQTGLTVVNALPVAEVIPVYVREGLMPVVGMPSSVRSTVFNRNGLVPVNAVVQALREIRYARTGNTSVVAQPVSDVFIAPPPGVPTHVFTVPREEVAFVVRN